ncbi:MAG: cyclic nucleotide-binding domain-containing protein [Pseudomonadota bacterium]|nr:cyclic nucleotide-binding domain-containing protein [Pseudomonadota bacterium]
MDVHEIERTGIFMGLDPEQRAQALAAFKPYELGAGEVLLEEGESDRSMLVVVEGALEVSLGGVPLGRVSRGELLGEMALFGSFDRRSATVTTLSATKVIILDEEGLRFLRLGDNPLVRQLEALALRTVAARLREVDQRIAGRAAGEPIVKGQPRGLFGRIANVFGVGGGEVPRTSAPRLLDVLKATHGFAGRDDSVLMAVAARLQMVPVAAGEVLIEEGKTADDAYIVAEGKVGVYCAVSPDRYERVATLGPGQVFGVVAFTDERARTATCRVLEPSWLARISGPTFRKLEAETTIEGRAFRRGLIDALSVQLRLANEHLLTLSARPNIH